MGRALRHELHDILKAVPGVGNVYFQPPPNIVMSYPCIVYERDSAYSASADNQGYRYKQRYQVTLIDRSPDSPAIDVLVSLPYSAYQRHFVADGLHHDVFVLYF